MSRFDKIDFDTVTENLLDNIYDEINKIRHGLQDNLENISFQQEMFWNGVYSGFLQIEELAVYLNPDFELSNDDHDSDILDLEKTGVEGFEQRIDIVQEKVDDLINQTGTDTAFLIGMRFSFILFYSQLRNVLSAIAEEDFEEFHVHLKNLVPAPTEYLFTEGNWQETYFSKVKEAGFDI